LYSHVLAKAAKLTKSQPFSPFKLTLVSYHRALNAVGHSEKRLNEELIQKKCVNYFLGLLLLLLNGD